MLCRLPLALLLLALLAGCGAPDPAARPPAPPPPAATATATPAVLSPTAAPSPTPATAALGAPLLLRVGETASVGPLALTFAAIVSDSRCPTQVACVWEGAAEVQIAVAGESDEIVTLTLSGQGRETDESRVELAGYRIRLTGLEPYPGDTGPIPEGNYVATFVVEDARPTYRPVGDFEGVIVPEQDARGVDPRAEGYWTPAERDVLALEAGLAAFLRAAAPERSPELWRELPAYKRQYSGLIRNGRRLVYASFFCSAPDDEWRRRVLFVLDGGDCFFQLTYDVAGGAYGDLMVNGES